MKTISSIDSYLNDMLRKKSKIDGRLLVVAILFGYFCILFISSFFANYNLFWRKLGVPALRSPFVDLRAVLSAFECVRLNSDIFLKNSCFPQIAYPRTWSILTGLGLNQDHTVFLGVLFALLFFCLTLIIIGRLNYYEAIIYSLIFCSPPVMLLVERGNVDIIIYSFLALVLIIINKIGVLILRFCAYFLIFFLALLKLFPIFGLTVILREKKKYFIVFTTTLATAFLAYYFHNQEEMRNISQVFVHGNKDWYSFGYTILFFKIQDFVSNFSTILSKSDLNKLIKIIIFTIFNLSIFLLFIKILFSIAKQFKSWLSSDFISENLTDHFCQGKYIDHFRLGSSIYMGLFIIAGRVLDYKLTVLIFVIPQILAWIKSRNLLSLPSSLALLGIVTTLYTSAFLYHWGVDEIINWFLLGDFLYIFSLSLPEWLKISIHNGLVRKYQV